MNLLFMQGHSWFCNCLWQNYFNFPQKYINFDFLMIFYFNFIYESNINELSFYQNNKEMYFYRLLLETFHHSFTIWLDCSLLKSYRNLIWLRLLYFHVLLCFSKKFMSPIHLSLSHAEVWNYSFQDEFLKFHLWASSFGQHFQKFLISWNPLNN